MRWMLLCGVVTTALVAACSPQYTWAQSTRGPAQELLEDFQQQQVLKEQRLSRPTRLEREEVKKLLGKHTDKLEQVDKEFLLNLQKQVEWTGREHRLMHEIWGEAMGRPWEEPKSDQPKVDTEAK